MVFKEKIDKNYLEIEEIKKRIQSGEDIIGRNDEFKKIIIDSSFPDFFLKNLKDYSSWIE